MGVAHAALAIEDEVAAELPDVGILRGPAGDPATQHQLQIMPHHAQTHQSARARRPQLECLVQPAIYIGHNRKRQRKGCHEFRELRHGSEGDNQHVAAELLDFAVDLLHLDEVCPASDSGEVAEEDQEQRFSVKRLQLEHLAIGF